MSNDIKTNLPNTEFTDFHESYKSNICAAPIMLHRKLSIR